MSRLQARPYAQPQHPRHLTKPRRAADDAPLQVPAVVRRRENRESGGVRYAPNAVRMMPGHDATGENRKASAAVDSESEDRPEKVCVSRGERHAHFTQGEIAMSSTDAAQAIHDSHAFTTEAREAIYQAIFMRRDVRASSCPRPCPTMLSRIITAAHYAPSVGFSQPWNFLVVKSEAVKRKVHAAFAEAHAEAAEMFDGDKRATYKTLKLKGIIESPVGICITCDRERTGPVVVGTHMKTMDLYSSVCAVQNLWLAARRRGWAWAGSASSTSMRCRRHSASRRASRRLPIFASAMSATSTPSRSWKPPAGCRACRSRIWSYFDQWGARDDAQPLVEQLMLDQRRVQAAANSTAHQPVTERFHRVKPLRARCAHYARFAPGKVPPTRRHRRRAASGSPVRAGRRAWHRIRRQAPRRPAKIGFTSQCRRPSEFIAHEHGGIVPAGGWAGMAPNRDSISASGSAGR